MARPHAAAAAATSVKRPADDLKAITGIGPKIEKLLNGEGIFHYEQIAALGGPALAVLEEKLGFRGRVKRDNWVDQAKVLSSN